MRPRRGDLLAVALAAALGGGCWWRDVPASPSCPRDRSIVLTTQAEADAFATCSAASGVVIRGFENIDTRELRELSTIDGDLVIGPSTSTEDITLTELHEVGGAVTITSNDLLRGVFLPRLAHAGRIEVDGNLSLQTLSLPSLETVDTSVVVTDDQELSTIDASALANVGKGLVVTDLPRLTTLVVPSLAHAQSLTVDRVPKLPPDTEQALRGKLAAP
jgi:hypothetical protein|nr:hypothetical protein [Kofleriaceae bacterium]